MNLFEYPSKDTKTLIKVIRKKFLNIYKILAKVDMEDASNFLKRNSYYQQELSKNGSSCCNSCDSTGDIYIPEQDMTQKEHILQELTSPWRIEVTLKELMEYLSTRFFNIKKSGIADWNEEAEKYVLTEVLKEGVNIFYHKKLVEELKRKSDGYSTDHLLIANPSQFSKMFPEHELELLGENSMNGIVKSNFTVADGFLGDFNTIDKISDELTYLERDSRFEKSFSNGIEGKEKFMWIRFGQIKKEDFSGLYSIGLLLTSLPFELNKKLAYGFQISETFRAVCTGEEFEFSLRKEGDSSKSNNLGVCISCIYSLDTYKQGIQGFKLIFEDGTEIESKRDSLILLKSRKLAYKIEFERKKSFLIQYWVNGPIDTRNQLF